MNFYIRKSSGEREQFDLKKFRRSLKKAGAKDKTIHEIVQALKKKRPKSTEEIHNTTTRLLKKQAPTIADRYNLKRAIMELGPDGFPFEKFVAQLFKAQKYKTKINQIIQGKCVSHEVDVIAQKKDCHYTIEAKFHNRPGLKSDVKVGLYVWARFEDIRDAWKQDPNHPHDEPHIPWIVTNTKFTSELIKYGECKKMKLISWNYPAQNNLAQLVEKYDLFPITTLTSLNKRQKRTFIKEGFVMCKHARDNQKLLKKLGLSPQEIKKIINESEAVCKI